MSRFSIPDMTCGHCKKTVETALHGLDAQARIDVDLEKREIELHTSAPTDQVLAVLKSAGYEASPI